MSQLPAPNAFQISRGLAAGILSLTVSQWEWSSWLWSEGQRDVDLPPTARAGPSVPLLPASQAKTSSS